VKRSPTVLLLAAAVIFLLSAAAPSVPSVNRSASFPQPDAWPSVAVVDHAGETLGPGVTYDRWRLRTGIGPLIVHVTTVDLRNPNVALAVATHRGQIVGPDEPLSAMADRAHAQAAINADYFDINESGAQLNVVALGGRFLHQSNGAAALVVGPANAVSMGPVSLRATLSAVSGTKVSIGSINDWSKESGLALLTPEFGAADAGADMEIVLTPAPSPAPQGAYRVAARAQSLAQLLPLGPADLGIVARGAEQVGRLSAFGPNDVITLTYDGTPSPASILWAVGGGPLLLRDGAEAVDPVVPAAQETEVRYPVTGAGLSQDGSTLWLVAVDGRAPVRSVGITRPMLRSLLASFGARQAMAFDSGGSTEMAIRHLGDATVSVANAPSDGKERSIADALLVINSASPGPAAQLLLRPDAAVVLAGSHVQLYAAAIDASMQPAQFVPSDVRFTVDSPCCASVDANGQVTALAPGDAHVGAALGTIASSPVTLSVVSKVDALSISGYARDVAAGASIRLVIAASTSDGRAIVIDPPAVRWTVTGDGRIQADGTFVGGTTAGIASVSAQAGGATAALRVFVGEHPVRLPAGAWRFSASPATVSGAVDTASAPDGSAAVHLDYNFGQGGATRAAYANAEIKVDGEPLGLGMDVYGDGNGEWLRGAYRNADGIVDSVTIARHVDWSGWKTLRLAIPPQVRWPVVLTRVYAVEPRRDAIEAGDLWFRNLTAFYAGPAAASP
jgi:hypothetical protein